MCSARSGKYTDVPRSKRLGVERAAFFHVVRHVGNAHAEPVVAVRQPLQRNRIVEVARVLAVDGHGQSLAEVCPTCDVPLADGRPQTLRLGDRFLAMGVRQIVLADDDGGVDTRRVDGAEHLEHSTGRRPRRRRPARQLHDDHVARRGLAIVAGGDLDISQNPAIERQDITGARPVPLISSDQPAVCAFEDADDPPFGTIAALMLDARDDPVAVEGLVDVRRADVEVVFRLVVGTTKP